MGRFGVRWAGTERMGAVHGLRTSWYSGGYHGLCFSTGHLLKLVVRIFLVVTRRRGTVGRSLGGH